MRIDKVLVIGLNLFLDCDPEGSFQDHLYQRVFKNDSNQEIDLVYYDYGTNKSDNGSIIISDTLNLSPGTEKQDFFEPGYSSDGVEEDDFETIMESNISMYNTIDGVPKFELYVGNELIKEWSGIADYLGGEMNSPYNFDSWEIFKFEETLNPSYGLFIYVEIIFTITDEDIGN